MKWVFIFNLRLALYKNRFTINQNQLLKMCDQFCKVLNLCLSSKPPFLSCPANIFPLTVRHVFRTCILHHPHVPFLSFVLSNQFLSKLKRMKGINSWDVKSTLMSKFKGSIKITLLASDSFLPSNTRISCSKQHLVAHFGSSEFFNGLFINVYLCILTFLYL